MHLCWIIQANNTGMKNKGFNKIILLQAGLIAAIIFSVSSCNNNASSTDSTVSADKEAKSDTITKENDIKFIVSATEINLEEISLGQLAQLHGSTKNIREMGKMMEEDHRKSLAEVTTLANNRSMRIPVSISMNADADYKKLSDKPGAQFDKDYCDMMISGHKDAITMFEKESKETKDTAIRQWALATLPALHKHLDNATACQDRLKKM